MTLTRLGKEPSIAADATVEDTVLGHYVEVGSRMRISHSSFGDYSYIMEDGQVLFAEIGKFCSIASNVRVNPPNHPTWRASQHHFTYRANDYFVGEEQDAAIFAWRREKTVTVGHDVWIGHAATILPGVSVGSGAVVAAGSIVTKNIAPYSIVAGVPAHPLKQRFPALIAERLQVLAWWDWPHDDIHRALVAFQSLPIEAFLEKYEAISSR